MKAIKITALLMVTLLAFGSLVACGASVPSSNTMSIYDKAYYDNLNEEISARESTAEAETTPPATEPPTTAEPRLSDTCDKIYASGYDADGNFYELVANETEDYKGTTIEFGIIKNNQWSVELTSEAPFLNADGLLPTYKDSESGSIYDTSYNIKYIGFGCFSSPSNSTIWNGNSGKFIHTIGIVNPPEQYHNTENKRIVTTNHGGNYRLLDLETLELKDTGLEYHYPYEAGCYRKGLFPFVNLNPNHHDPNPHPDGFYDENGNRVIDLSEFNIQHDNEMSDFIFVSGECTFTHINDQGTKYYITINNKGEVVVSQKRNN